VSERLTLQQAADRLGVHYMTAYRYVRLGKLQATKDGSTWVVEADDVNALLSRGTAPAEPGSARWDRRLESRLLSGDEAAAWSVVESALASGGTPRSVYEKMIGPAMRRIGIGWENGTLDVADEHLATLSVMRIIGRLSPQFNRRGRTRGSIIVAAAPGDHHVIATMMLGDLFREAGYDAVDLGAAVPPASLARMVAATDRLVGVALSASMPGNEQAIRDAVAAAHAAAPTTVVLGGPAIRDAAHALSLGADAWAADAEGAIAAFAPQET